MWPRRSVRPGLMAPLGVLLLNIGFGAIFNSDIVVAEGFILKIRFTRPRLLMPRGDCCHFIWEP